MSSVAVFVDAGYLFAQGSTALTGSKQPRSLLRLIETAVITELIEIADAKSGAGRLLRVYWYDGGLSSGQLTLEHTALAHTDHVKLRLGFMNNQGQQKGVDSLIITDLIELARNRAITDAVLLSGDEDVRIGVQIAQSFGVRLHLLGITPSRGSQSLQLLQEADTTTEWDSLTVAKFLSQKPAPVLSKLSTPPPQSSGGTISQEVTASIEVVAEALLSTLDSADLASLRALSAKQGGVPREIDGKLLAQCRTVIGRDLNTSEKRHARRHFNKLASKSTT